MIFSIGEAFWIRLSSVLKGINQKESSWLYEKALKEQLNSTATFSSKANNIMKLFLKSYTTGVMACLCREVGRLCGHNNQNLMFV